MNWVIIILFAVAVIALIIFLVNRNQKDEREFEQQLKDDYHKPKDKHNDIETEEITK